MSGEAVSSSRLRVLELYSGLGGMHWALKESGVSYEIVMAVDINTTANKIYRHNFPHVNLNSFGIEKLTLKTLHKLRPNAILMSPPCQPFSRVGKKGDCDDVRTKSFLHIMELLKQLDEKPRYVLVENVKGFETSRTRQILVETLHQCDYSFQEYLLTPLQFGIPNSRLRYYMIAKHASSLSPFTQTLQILYSLPDRPLQDGNQSHSTIQHEMLSTDNSTKTCQLHSPHTSSTRRDNTVDHSHGNKQNYKQESTLNLPQNSNSSINCVTSSNICLENEVTNEQIDVTDNTNCGKCAWFEDANGDSTQTNECEQLQLDLLLEAGRNMRYCEEEDALINNKSQPLLDFMEVGTEKDFSHLLVPDKSLRQFVVMDVVLPQLKKSTCFTKRYGHYIEGAGSLIQMSTSAEDTAAASQFKSQAIELKNKNEWGEEELSIVRKLKLRYFSPREVANLLCFPKEFEFPDDVSDIQKYRCLGNSLNVYVVSRLIQLMALGG